MKCIDNSDSHDEIYFILKNRFNFKPHMKQPIKTNIKHVCYKLNELWSQEQEYIVNDIFESISNDDIYAVDYYHSYFEYNPKEKIKLYFYYRENDTNYYFPSYYPDGDYHFFISKDWKYGMFGLPFRKMDGMSWNSEIIIFGDELIKKFAQVEDKLNIEKLKTPYFLNYFVKK